MGQCEGQAGLETNRDLQQRDETLSRVDGAASSLAKSQAAKVPSWQRGLRWLIHGWFYLSRGMTLGVRAIALNAQGEVFLVRHTYVRGWHLPGGGVEWGQSIRSALAREMEEEGHLVALAEPELLGMYWNRHASRRDHVVVFGIREAWQREPRRPDREIAEAGFFPLDALPEGTTEGTRRRIAEWLENRPRDEYW